MNPSLGAKSILWFGLSVVILILMTLFESSLSGLSITTERVISLLLLVLPALVGIIHGVLSMTRKESKLWMAILGVLLNTLFALFHIFVISFAG